MQVSRLSANRNATVKLGVHHGLFVTHIASARNVESKKAKTGSGLVNVQGKSLRSGSFQPTSFGNRKHPSRSKQSGTRLGSRRCEGSWLTGTGAARKPAGAHSCSVQAPPKALTGASTTAASAPAATQESQSVKSARVKNVPQRSSSRARFLRWSKRAYPLEATLRRNAAASPVFS